MFLGYDPDGSFQTVVLYNPDTGRISHRHQQDVLLNDSTDYPTHRNAERNRLRILPPAATNITKHHKYLCEDSDDDDDDGSTKTVTTETVSPNSNAETVEENPWFAKPVRTRTGRLTTVPSYLRESLPLSNSAFAVVTTSEELLYTPTQLTEHQKQKMSEKNRKARLNSQPMSYRDLKNHPDSHQYMQAIDKEVKAMPDRGVLHTVRRPINLQQNQLGKLLLLLSRKRSGRFKARLVFNGRQQKFKLTSYYGSPTLSRYALCTCLALAATRNYNFRSLDITSAFLCADLPDNASLYAAIPEGHPDHEKRDTHVLHITKNMYGLKEAPRFWWNHFCKTLTTTLNLKQSHHEPCLFFSRHLLLLVYVDDILLLGKDDILKQTYHQLKKKFQLTRTAINEEVDFLGCNISKDTKGRCTLSESSYIQKITKELNVKPKQTPLPADLDLSSKENNRPYKDKEFLYRHLLGKLGYLRYSRPDLLNCIQQLSKRCCDTVSRAMVKALLHAFGYLVATRDLVLRFFPEQTSTQLVSLTDAPFANDTSNRRSCSGYYIYYGVNMVGEFSGSQTRVATSAS